MRRVALLLLVGVPLAEAWFSWLRVPLARRPVLEGVDLRRRRVAIDEDWAVSVFEIASVGSRVERWMESGEVSVVDPFGAVAWPGSVAAARALKRVGVAGSTVVCVGCDTGLEALAAVDLGAARVYCLDYSEEALALARRSADAAGCGDQVETRLFDLYDDGDELPDHDVLVCADVLYDLALAARCGEVAGNALRRQAHKGQLVATDSQRYAGHGDAFLEALGVDGAAWEPETVAFTGSGLLVEDDQTYTATTNVLHC